MTDNSFTQQDVDTLLDNFDRVHYEIDIIDDNTIVIESLDSGSTLSLIRDDLIEVQYRDEIAPQFSEGVSESFDDLEDAIEWCFKFS